MTEQEISKMVEEAGSRLLELVLDMRLNNRPDEESLKKHPNRDSCAFNYKEYVSELESIELDLNSAYARLSRLRHRFTNGQMKPYRGLAIAPACENTVKALVEVGQEKEQVHTDHSPKTRELYLQKWAIMEATGIVGSQSRRVREVARQIMVAGGLEIVTDDGKLMPSDATLTLWLREIRQFDK